MTAPPTNMKTVQEFKDDSAKDAPVRGFLHRADAPDADGLVLTHGAGANSQSPLLTALAQAFCAAGITVLRCDLPFRQTRPHGPPVRGSAERDQEGLRAAVAALHRETDGKIFLGGHSYGGRQATMLAAAEPLIARALLLLSYPLHPPNKAELSSQRRGPVTGGLAQMRTAHFPALRVPSLFAHGERDGFGSREEMEAALTLIPARTELMMVAGAGHELMTARNRSELPARIAQAFLAFART